MDKVNARIGILSVTAVIAFALGYNLSKIGIPEPSRGKFIPSPRDTLIPTLSKNQAEALAYPPDYLPGARDVKTPFGTMRVYEWGSKTGRKVVFVHGDATPSPMFGPIANKLVARGCRVLILDLWGRGYSDAPLDSQHNATLFTLQVLFAITSSPIPWTGAESGKFSLVGFSMGGPICMNFLNHFPELIESLVLLAPAGLIRNLPPEYTREWFKHPSLISGQFLRQLIGNLLGVDTSSGPKLPLENAAPIVDFSPSDAVQFQFDHHVGHIHSFLSTIQYGPIQNQTEIWGTTCDIISGRRETNSPLNGGKILVVCGDDDTVIPPRDVEEDLIELTGDRDHFSFKTVPGGHGFPYPQGEQIADFIAEFWVLD